MEVPVMTTCPSKATTVLDYLYAPESLSHEALFAEIEHLHATGTPPVSIPTRVGWKRATLLTTAKRANRPDILELLKEPNEDL